VTRVRAVVGEARAQARRACVSHEDERTLDLVADRVRNEMAADAPIEDVMNTGMMLVASALLSISHATLAQKPASTRAGIADVNGTRLYYETTGSGPHVVLLHGGNLDSRMWDDQVPFLAKSFTVTRYDIRPYGRSGPAEKGFSSVDDLAALMDFLGIERASLVGLSLGGRIAIDFALTHPDRLDKLVVMGPGLTGFPFNQKDEAVLAMLAVAKKGDANAAMDLWLKHPMMAPAMARPELATRIRPIAMDNARIWTNLAVGERVPNPPAIERLGEIRAPTLVIVGARDVPDIQQIVKLLAAGIRGARVEVIPDAAHMPNMEDAPRVNRLLGEFLPGK
jgi:pimeloyl-ACP methyl ester carboxylesterase